MSVTISRRTAALLLAQRYPGGIDAVAPQMGKRPDTMRKELIGAPGAKWGGDDEELLMDLCMAAGVANPLAPLEASAFNRGATLMPLGAEGASEEAFAVISELAQDFSKMVEAVTAAESPTSPGGCGVTGNELKDIERKAVDLMGAIQHCLKHVRQHHEASKPSHLRAVGG